MRRALLLSLAFLSAGTWAAAQTPPPQQQPPRGQMPDLAGPPSTTMCSRCSTSTRTSSVSGRSKWDTPDGPLGPAGRSEGTTVYTALGNGKYQALTDATGPGGKVTIKEVITYQREQKTLTRDVIDSRGFTYSQGGTIGGDLGRQLQHLLRERSDHDRRSVGAPEALAAAHVTARLPRVGDRLGGTTARSRTTGRLGGGKVPAAGLR